MSSFWFANDFEIESKYHRKTVVLLLTAHILSLQDVVLRSRFFPYTLQNRLLVKVFLQSLLHSGESVIATCPQGGS